MASDLKWRTGIGWGYISILFMALLVALVTRGFFAYFAWAVLIFIVLVVWYQYRKWNRRGWPSVHYRSMLLYAHLAGLEMGRAEAEGRTCNKVAVCQQLALLMCGPGKEASVNALVARLAQEKGSYLASLIVRHWADLLPDSSEDRLKEIAEELARADLRAELVICGVVENTFGSLEAARYSVALVEGEAH